MSFRTRPEKGEDPEFVGYIQSLQAQESGPNAPGTQGVATSESASIAATTR